MSHTERVAATRPNLSRGEEAEVEHGLRTLELAIADAQFAIPRLVRRADDPQEAALKVSSTFEWVKDQAESRADSLRGGKFARDSVDAFIAHLEDARTLVRHMTQCPLSTEGFRVRGNASISSVDNDAGSRLGWAVRFENTGDQPFIGTASFVRSKKNAGFGLESMGLPSRDGTATQFIDPVRHYGLKPEPGEPLRLGVRGHSFREVPLPSEGETRIELTDFFPGISRLNPERYFRFAEVSSKQIEKHRLGKVSFTTRGRAWNP